MLERVVYVIATGL